MTDLNGITIGPGVVLGEAVVGGTLMPVREIVEAVAEGRSVEEILDVHDSLTESDVRAAMRYAKDIAELARALGDVQFAILYGSTVSGAIRDDSDVDLAVMYASPLGPEDLLRLVAEVSALFHRSADLLDLRRAGPIVKMQVLRHGRPVVVNDVKAFEEFRMYTPGEYFDFKLCRRPVEEALVERARR